MKSIISPYRLHGGPFDKYDEFTDRADGDNIEIYLKSHLRPGVHDEHLTLAPYDTGTFSRDWLVKAKAAYRRSSILSALSGMDFDFVEMKLEGRCCALLFGGRRCDSAACDGEILCSNHLASKGADLITNPVHLRVARGVQRNEVHQMSYFLEFDGIPARF